MLGRIFHFPADDMSVANFEDFLPGEQYGIQLRSSFFIMIGLQVSLHLIPMLLIGPSRWEGAP